MGQSLGLLVCAIGGADIVCATMHSRAEKDKASSLLSIDTSKIANALEKGGLDQNKDVVASAIMMRLHDIQNGRSDYEISDCLVPFQFRSPPQRMTARAYVTKAEAGIDRCDGWHQPPCTDVVKMSQGEDTEGFGTFWWPDDRKKYLDVAQVRISILRFFSKC